MLDRIDHVALAVSDLESAITLYEQQWKMKLSHRETVEDQGVEEAMFQIGESFIQLLCPLTPDSTVARFIESRGEGLHHVAYAVENIEQALESLKRDGITLIDATPRKGSRGTSVAFVHPRANRGVLIELVQSPR